VNGVSAPGLDRGLSIEGDTQEELQKDIKKENFVLNMEDMMKPMDSNTFDFLNVKPITVHEEEEEGEVVSSETNQDIDALLPTHIAPQKDLSKKTVSTNEALKRREWAHEINVNEPFDNFYDLVPEMAMQVRKKSSITEGILTSRL
jgi:antiviral helicase SKI2